MTAPVLARAGWRGLIEEYRDRLPVTADTPVITLLEGATPLVPAPYLSELTGCDVFLKVDCMIATIDFFGKRTRDAEPK